MHVYVWMFVCVSMCVQDFSVSQVTSKTACKNFSEHLHMHYYTKVKCVVVAA